MQGGSTNGIIQVFGSWYLALHSGFGVRLRDLFLVMAMRRCAVCRVAVGGILKVRFAEVFTSLAFSC